MRKELNIGAILLCMAGIAPAAHSAERITLRNGFALQCSHHAEVDGHVRLFQDAGEENYIEFRPEEIASYEEVAEPAVVPATEANPLRGAAAEANAKLSAQLSAQDLHEMLSKAGRAHNLDVDLLASVVKAESGGNVAAVSRAGARGLMQLMPATAEKLGVKDSFEPEQNVSGGTAYLDALLTSYHNNLALALAAYNAGPAAVAKYRGIPPYRETRAYVARVIHEFNRRVRARQAQARVQAKTALASATAAGAE
jgi:soluble lytic murein transglycosylase-like protein